MRAAAERDRDDPHARDPRRRLVGRDAIDRAFADGLPLRWLVVREGALAPDLEALCERAAAAGAEVERAGERRHRRVCGDADVAAWAGPAPDADLDALMARGGAVWLLVGAAYAGNVGAALRTAEVSGADAVCIDNAFDHAQRREARRASMRADRCLPLRWERANAVIGAARRAGKTLVGVEESGDVAPWDVALDGSLLIVVGGEADGVPPAILRRCDVVTRIPMKGFVASYNLQAAVAIVAAERLRQLEGGR